MDEIKVKKYLKSFLWTYPIAFKDPMYDDKELKERYVDFAVDELFIYMKKQIKKGRQSLDNLKIIYADENNENQSINSGKGEILNV